MSEMKQLICISEENHGVIGVASDFLKAKQFLLETDWVGEHTDFYDEKAGGWKSLPELFGENWQEEFLKQDEDFFDGSFYFHEISFLE